MAKKKGSAISKKKIVEICNLILCGNYVKTSVRATGVKYNTFLDYMKRGKKGEEPYSEYYEMVEQAKAGFESDAVRAITESGKNGNVGAYMWMLPRMYPNRWGKVNRQEVKVNNTQKIELVKYSDTVDDKED